MSSSNRSLAQKFRDKFIDPDTAVLRDAGVIDECGVHTKAGRNLMWSLLFSKEGFRDELVAYIKQAEAVEEKTNKKSS